MAIEIDPEFRALIPALLPEERHLLEAVLIAEGCRDPLIVWNGVLLDGHHRFEICTAHQIPFQVVEQPCASRDEAKAWIIQHQFARRNLNDFQRAELVLVLEPLLAIAAAKRSLANLKPDTADPSMAPIGAIEGRTQENLAKMAGVSKMVIWRARTVKQYGSPELQAQVRSGEVALSAAATQLQRGITAPLSPSTRKRRTPRTETALIDAVAELLEEFRRRRQANNDDLNTRKWIPHGISIKRQIDIANWLDGELASLIDRWRALSPSTDPRQGDSNNVH